MDRLREPLPSRVEGLPDLPSEALAVLGDGLSRLHLEGAGDEVRRALDRPPAPAPGLESVAINLTAVRDPVEAVRRHIVDSLTAIPILRRNGADAFVDIGSGGGYPGLPLAAVLPARRALLVDSVEQEGPLPARRARRDGSRWARRGVRRPGRGAGRGPPPSRALARSPRQGGRQPGRAGRARSAARRPGRAAHRLETRRPSDSSSRRARAGDRRDRRQRSRSSSRRPTGLGLDDHVLVVVDQGPSDAVRLSARPGRPPPGPALSPRPDAIGERRSERASARTANCGTLSRCGSRVLSDIHANLVALDAVLGAVGAVDAVWHLGDVVGYGPDPDGVVGRLSELGAVGVRGNHDAAAVGGLEIDAFNHDARRAMEWTRSAIGSTTRSWLAALPERRTESDFTLVHGSPRDPIWEYITTAPVARLNLEVLTTDLRAPWPHPSAVGLPRRGRLHRDTQSVGRIDPRPSTVGAA